MKHYNSRSEANQANAQASTGPKTEEGKRVASHNALKTGLTGVTVLLPTDNLTEYQQHLDAVQSRFQPQTPEEKQIAESIAHIEWRLRRIPTLETALLALARKKFADSHTDEPAQIRHLLIEGEAHTACEKQLANLALQESRLRRQHEKQTATLKALLAERNERRKQAMHEYASYYENCERKQTPFSLNDLPNIGSEFSRDELKRFIFNRRLRRKTHFWPTIELEQMCQSQDLDFLEQN